jgi:uncharacterized protein (DUF2141 family)
MDAVTGSPLANSSISLEIENDNSQVAALNTNDNGAFQFLHLPAGRYILSASHRGYLTSDYEGHDDFTTALVTGEGQDCCGNLQMRLTPGGVISGVIVEDSGDPVQQGRVVLYRETNGTGKEHLQRVKAEVADDTGAYEIGGLEPGNYFLAVSAEPWYSLRVRSMHVGSSAQNAQAVRSPLDLVYATTFYPDTTDENEATPIPIKGGERLKIDFSLHPVPAVHLRVQLPQQEDVRRGPFMVPTVEHQVFGESDSVSSTFFIHRPSGNSSEAEISVPPGQYVIRAPENSAAPGRQMTVDVTSDQIFNPSTGAQLADVTGKLALSTGEIPENLIMTLESPEGQGGSGGAVRKDGSFMIRNVPPGTYRLAIASSNIPLYIAKLMASGTRVAHGQISIGSDSVTLAAILAPDLNVTVSGFAKNDGKAVPGAMIVLVPEDPANRDIFRRDQSDWDGNFTLKNIEPGKYTIVAIQDGWTLDWAEPEVIRRYLPQGQKISVTERSPHVIQMDQAVEVQLK